MAWRRVLANVAFGLEGLRLHPAERRRRALEENFIGGACI